jgi:hypothetical protein
LDPQRRLYAWFEPDAMKQLLAEHFNGREDNGKRIYTLAMLALWLENSP